MPNRTAVSEIVLVGFPGVPEYFNSFLSAIFFLVYTVSLMANGIVMILVTFSTHLHQPMYLVIANLAASDLLFDTVTLPKLLAKYWFDDSNMTVSVCIFQMFCVHYFGTQDSYLLLLMAIDRYIAICQPLRYAFMMNVEFMIMACGLCWVILAPPTVITVAVRISTIPLCGQNINSLFCTHSTISALSCTDVSSLRVTAFTLALVVLLGCLALIIVSYILIVKEISSSTSAENWQKAFYTCATHLLVIALYFIPRVFVYIVTYIPLITIKSSINILLLALYTFVPHVASPIIYFLRTKKIAQTLRIVFRKK
ncbi:olfactory receptor 1E16-like [Hyperolius riggenbachi]|uniref:olfactory receptor 1E16-like n=1 Tax=Hyperolius riggenbachi TaxID=752182 RepID=UPI0035A26350